MPGIASVNAPPQFARPDPVRPDQSDTVRNQEKTQEIAASKRQDIEVQTQRREEEKPPSRDGTGWVIDKEA